MARTVTVTLELQDAVDLLGDLEAGMTLTGLSASERAEVQMVRVRARQALEAALAQQSVAV